jgi:hypothetical protein
MSSLPTSSFPVDLPPVVDGERRRESRSLVSATAVLFNDRRYLGTCLVENLSAGGALLIGEYPLEASNSLELLLQTAGRAPLRLSAEVVRRQRREDGTHQFAVHFVTR